MRASWLLVVCPISARGCCHRQPDGLEPREQIAVKLLRTGSSGVYFNDKGELKGYGMKSTDLIKQIAFFISFNVIWGERS